MSNIEIDLELNILNLMLNETKQSYIIENLNKAYFQDTINSVIFECAKELYMAGAGSVYCVAGLISAKDKKKGK